MSKINVGIIGAGMIAEKHIDNFQKTGKADVVWVADINEQSLAKVKNQFNIPKTTNDYQDILKDESIDTVVICTPPKLHKNMFIDTVSAKKHILTEKPTAMSLDEVDEMIEAKNKYPELKISDCSCRHSRLQPKFKFIKDIIDTGKLGQVYYIHHNSLWRQARGGIEYHPTAKWFLNKAISGGGCLFDWGVYDLSFHLGVLGDIPQFEKVNSIFLKSGLDNVDPGADIYDVEEHYMANLKMSNGLTYYWERSTHSNMEADNETRIYGTKAGIKLNYCSWDPTKVEFFDVENEGKGKARKEVFEVNMENHQSDEYALAEHWVNVMEGKEEPGMPLELSRKHLDIIFNCYKVAE